MRIAVTSDWLCCFFTSHPVFIVAHFLYFCPCFQNPRYCKPSTKPYQTEGYLLSVASCWLVYRISVAHSANRPCARRNRCEETGDILPNKIMTPNCKTLPFNALYLVRIIIRLTVHSVSMSGPAVQPHLLHRSIHTGLPHNNQDPPPRVTSSVAQT